jgi:hypothetical protein
VKDAMKRHGAKDIYREIVEKAGISAFKEPNIPYSVSFDPKTGPLSPKNSYFWDLTN